MRVNRRLLYSGVFLAAIGGVLVAVDVRAVETSNVADALRLWPLAVMAIGLGLIVRRTRISLPGGMLAAALPGLLLGGAFALAPRIAIDCGTGGTPSTMATHQGMFDGSALVSVTTGCGELDVSTGSGSGWQLDAGNTRGRTPIIESSAQALSIDAGGSNGWHFFDSGRDAWRLTLPTSPIDHLSFVVNAGRGKINLPGAQIGSLAVTTNAAETTVDLSGSSLASLSGTVNAGLLSVHLPAGADIAGSMEVNAGELQVCTPSGLGLRVHHTGVLNGILVNDLHQADPDWQSPDYLSAAHHADLNVSVNLGTVQINPIGGCK